MWGGCGGGGGGGGIHPASSMSTSGDPGALKNKGIVLTEASVLLANTSILQSTIEAKNGLKF